MTGDVGALTLRMRTMLRMHETIWYVVEESRPVLISSMNSVLQGPTTISPAGTQCMLMSIALQSDCHQCRSASQLELRPGQVHKGVLI